MASPREVVNDLRVRAALLPTHRYSDADLIMALNRAAQTMERLLAKIEDLEAVAEVEAQRFEAYVAGPEFKR